MHLEVNHVGVECSSLMVAVLPLQYNVAFFSTKYVAPLEYILGQHSKAGFRRLLIPTYLKDFPQIMKTMDRYYKSLNLTIFKTNPK